MRVVLGIDGSETSVAAVRFVAAFPFPSGTETTVVSVVEPLLGRDEVEPLPARARVAVDDLAGRSRAEAVALVEASAERLRAARLATTTEVRTGTPAAEVLAAADAAEADLIAVGSHGRSGVGRFLLGSVSDQVLRHASRSVLVVSSPEDAPDRTDREPPVPGRPWRILVGFDGSAPADRAVGFCAGLALDDRVSVRLLTVLPMVTMFRQDIRQELDEAWRHKRAAARDALERAAGRLRDRGADVTTDLSSSGDPSDALLAAGEGFDADLIVLGHKGRSATRQFLMGSVAPRVVHHARRAVVVVR